MEKYRNFSLFIILIPTPDFPHFYYMLGGNLGSLLYGDVSVMNQIIMIFHLKKNHFNSCKIPVKHVCIYKRSIVMHSYFATFESSSFVISGMLSGFFFHFNSTLMKVLRANSQDTDQKSRYVAFNLITLHLIKHFHFHK